MALYDEFKDRRADFEILAFHDTQAKSLADLDERMKPLEAEVWKRKLPFPILLDDTGTSLRTFGVTSFPTLVGIDPEGRVVRGGGDYTLRQWLLETDKGVAAALEKLKGAAGADAFAQAVEAVAAAPHGGYVLATFADKDATAAQIPVLAAALRKLPGFDATGFFLGPHGLASEDAAVRLAAAQALGEVGDEEALYGIVEFVNREPDAEVKAALMAAVEKIQKR